MWSRERSACRKEEGVRILIGSATSKAHLSVEIQALIVRAMNRISLNKLVVQKDSTVRNKIKQFVCIDKVWKFKKLVYQKFGEICAISKSIGVDLSQLVHNRY